MEKDIKYLGVPNVCFSLTDKDDNREKEFTKQRIERGFDDSETWSLRDTIAEFIIPRLERYIELSEDLIMRSEKDLEDLNSFLKAMKLLKKENEGIISKDEERLIQRGLEVFPRVFIGLWW